MESFSLLKYWRTTTTSSSAAALPAETEDSSSSASSDDDGPFFDLEFAVPDEDDDEEGDLEEDFSFSVPADNLSLSPSDDRLFFKGRLGAGLDEPGKHHNGHAHHLSLKSKLLVFALGLRKNQNPNQSHRQLNGLRPADPTTSPAPASARKPRHGRFFAVKLDEVPIVSLFAREKPQRPSVDEEDLSRRFSKENLQKYLGKIKPLHHHVRRAQQLAEDSHLPAGLRVVCKHLGKSRSASSAVAAAPPPPPPAVTRRRDDSLLQQQDGIQSAIAHCKRSFNGDRGTPTASTSAAGDPPLFSPDASEGRILTGTQFAESCDSSLQRSRSDSCDERTTCTDQCMAGGLTADHLPPLPTADVHL